MRKVGTKNKMKGLFGFLATFAMALGIGVSLAPRDVKGVKAADETISLTNIGTDLSTTANTTIAQVTVDGYELNYYQVKRQSSGANHAMLLAKGQSPFIGNKTAIPGHIKSIDVKTMSGSSGKVSYHVHFGSGEFIAPGSGGTAVVIGAGNTSTFTNTNLSGDKYFAISLGNSENGQVQNITIKYEASSTSVVSALGVDPTSKTYVTTDVLQEADFSVSVTKDGVAGTNADYTAKIGIGSGSEFVGSPIVWGTTKPKVTDTTIQFKANLPQTIGGSDFLTADVAITVTEPVLESISVTGEPVVKNYYVGDVFNPEGITVLAHYDVVDDVDVTEEVTFAPSPLTVGTTSVTVSYGGKTTTIDGLTVTVPNWSKVKYEISAKDTLITSGVGPVGSSAALVETYSTSKQMTGTHSQTLTLSGYNNVKITEITIWMRSNGSSGAGNLTYSLNNGADYTAIVSSAPFNHDSWNGAWSTSYVPVVKAVDIEVSSSIKIKVAATANSLYAEAYQIKWEQIEAKPVTSVTVSPKSGTIYSGGTNNSTIQLGADVLPVDATFKDVSWNSSSDLIATVNSSGLVTAVAPGVATITATAVDGSEMSDTATITVLEKAVSSIAPSGTLEKDEYNIGEPFDPTGLVFTATYNNGETAVIAHNQLSFDPATFSVEDTEVEVSFGGKSVVIENIVVNDIQLTGIVASGTLSKANYFVGDTFDPAGLTITAQYSNDTTAVLAYGDVTFAPSVMAADTTSVVATYLTKSTTISGITVQSVVVESISIKTAASILIFDQGDAFSYDGLTIDAHYNNGTVVTKSSGFTVTGVDTSVLGAQTATIAFEGKTVTYEVTVRVARVLTKATMIYSGGTTSNLEADANNATTIGLDPAVFNVSAIKGLGGNNVGINKDGTIRLYYLASGLGNTLSVSIASDKSIGKLVFNFAAVAKAQIMVDGVEKYNSTPTANGSVTLDNLEGSSFSIQNVNTTSAQVIIKSIEIYYEGPAAVDPYDEAKAFADKFDYYSNGTALGMTDPETCLDNFLEMWLLWDELSLEAKALFKEHEDFAVERQRLLNWAHANGLTSLDDMDSGSDGIRRTEAKKDTSLLLTATVLIGVIGLTTLLGYFLLKKRETNK